MKRFDRLGIVAGCDEAGRGCLAGPVVAAAVILPTSFPHHLMSDSKKIKELKRLELAQLIMNEAIDYSVDWVLPSKIDKINILQASFLAMHKAIDTLNIKPELLLIDGNRFESYPHIKHQCIIKGDNLYSCIAAASILAKCCRDIYMKSLSNLYPVYNWQSNVGYPTVQHRRAILEYGASPHHRMSFKPLRVNLFPN